MTAILDAIGQATRREKYGLLALALVAPTRMPAEKQDRLAVLLGLSHRPPAEVEKEVAAFTDACVRYRQLLDERLAELRAARTILNKTEKLASLKRAVLGQIRSTLAELESAGLDDLVDDAEALRASEGRAVEELVRAEAEQGRARAVVDAAFHLEGKAKGLTPFLADFGKTLHATKDITVLERLIKKQQEIARLPEVQQRVDDATEAYRAVYLRTAQPAASHPSNRTDDPEYRATSKAKSDAHRALSELRSVKSDHDREVSEHPELFVGAETRDETAAADSPAGVGPGRDDSSDLAGPD